MTVAAAHAGLLLAQGAGRLLRTMEDRGMVAVLDPRLATARYGSFLRASLPPFWATTDPAVARAALRRLAGRSRERADGTPARTAIRPEGAGLGGPSGRILRTCGAASADYGQGAANVLKVPLLEYQPFTPRLGDWW